MRAFTFRLRTINGREYRDEGGSLLFESDFDRHTARDGIRLTVNDIGGKAETILFDQLDDGNHVRDWHGRVVGVRVHRVGEHRAMPGYRPGDQRATALLACPGRWMYPARTLVAAFDEQLALRAAGPERSIVAASLG